jgi:hypothetical protein
VLVDHPVEIRGGAVMVRNVSVAVPNAVGVRHNAGMFYIYGALQQIWWGTISRVTYTTA